MNEPVKRSGLTKFVFGCFGVIVASFIVLVIAVVWNWGQVKSLVESAGGTIMKLNGARTAVAARFKAQQVNVMYKKRNGIPMLSIQLINSPEVANSSPDELKATARNVAATAYAALTSPEDYSRYEVVFVQQQGVGITWRSTKQFVFSAAELQLPEAQESP